MVTQKLPVSGCQLPEKSPRAGFTGNWQLTTHNSAAPRRRGFTFTEVMFAVILLGIGFIMLAGMFPVAIQQTAQTQQETVGANLTLAAVKQLSQIATSNDMPPTGRFADGSLTYVAPRMLQFRETFVQGTGANWSIERSIDTAVNPLWKRMRGDVIFSEDPRYGFVAFYQRVPRQNIAKVIIIATQSQAAATYEFNRDVITQAEYRSGKIDNRSPYATLEPRRLEAIISDGGAFPDIIEIRKPAQPKVGGADPMGCLAEGAFVVVSDDLVINDEWPVGDDVGRGNGRIYRLGIRRTDLEGSPPNLSGKNVQVWELAPGYDLASRLENLPLPANPGTVPPVWPANPSANPNSVYSDHLNGDPALIYVIGRPQQDPTNEDSGYTGLTQDLAAYTTYINLK